MPIPTHARVEGDVPAQRWMLFLHGILGRGANWRSIARRFVASRPGWGAVLVDLRLHGGSTSEFSPPHTVAAAAADLLALDAALPGPIAGVLGHSFGGKVALEYVALRGAALDEAWTIDSAPGPRTREGDSPTREVLQLLEGLPPSLPSRDALIERVVAANLSRPLGEWLATNLARQPDGSFRLALDLGAIHALLDDYFAIDLWPIVVAPRTAPQLHLVIGDRSPVWSDADRARAASLGGAVHVHHLPTGHWVHVEDPDGLARLLG